MLPVTTWIPGDSPLGIDYRADSKFCDRLDRWLCPHQRQSRRRRPNRCQWRENRPVCHGLCERFLRGSAATGGPSGYNTHRAALQGTASGSTDGADVNALVAAGYDWKRGNLSIGPTASFQYSYIGLNGFSETGSLAPLKFPDQNTESERTAFGAKASYEWKVGHITVIPQVDAAWQHEFGYQLPTRSCRASPPGPATTLRSSVRTSGATVS